MTPDGTWDIYEYDEDEIEMIKLMPGWPNSISGNGTDSYGFAALPGGSYCAANNCYNSNDNLVSWWGGGKTGYWWTDTEDSRTFGIAVLIELDTSSGAAEWEKEDMLSVRCVRD